jgi:hypothetical protein
VNAAAEKELEMSIATEARSYAELAVSQGKNALTQASSTVKTANRKLAADAPKPAYAALGAADLLATAVTKRVEDLPVDAVNGVSKAQQTSQSLITRAQTDALAAITDLRGRVDAGLETVSTLPSTAKSAGEAYLNAAKAAGEAYVNTAKSTGGAYVSTAKGIFDSLTDRGAAKAAELKKDPRVAKLLGQLGDTAVELGEVAAPIAKSAFDAVTPDPEPVHTSPARKAAAGKSPARKATSKASTTKKSTPAAKSAASKASARTAPAKSTAKKAPARAAGKSTGA